MLREWSFNTGGGGGQEQNTTLPLHAQKKTLLEQVK